MAFLLCGSSVDRTWSTLTDPPNKSGPHQKASESTTTSVGRGGHGMNTTHHTTTYAVGGVRGKTPTVRLGLLTLPHEPRGSRRL